MEPRFAQHHGGRGVPPAGHRPGGGEQRSRRDSPSTERSTGYAPADFILGTPQSFTTPGPEVRGRVAEWRDGFFVLDKWQVSRKLTLNYGLRYELPTVPYTINGIATDTECEPDGA